MRCKKVPRLTGTLLHNAPWPAIHDRINSSVLAHVRLVIGAEFKKQCQKRIRVNKLRA